MDFFKTTAAARIIFKLPPYFYSLSPFAVVAPDTTNGHQNLEKPIFKALLAATESSGGMDLKTANSNARWRLPRAARVLECFLK